MSDFRQTLFSVSGQSPAVRAKFGSTRGAHCRTVDAMDYYEELGVGRAATDIDIKKA
jgi:hypothetical protein